MPAKAASDGAGRPGRGEDAGAPVFPPPYRARIRGLFGVLRAITAAVFFSSAAGLAFSGTARERSSADLRIDVVAFPVLALEVAAEFLIAVLCAWPRAGRARGVAVLAWCAGILVFRASALPGWNCDCLRGVGMPEGAVWPAWCAVVGVGAGMVATGPREKGAKAGVWLAVGALCLMIPSLLALVGTIVARSCRFVDRVEIRGSRSGGGTGILEISNPTDRAAYIGEIRSSCHCLVVATKPMTVLPGQMATLSFRFDPVPSGVTPEIVMRVRFGDAPPETCVVPVAAE